MASCHSAPPRARLWCEIRSVNNEGDVAPQRLAPRGPPEFRTIFRVMGGQWCETWCEIRCVIHRLSRPTELAPVERSLAGYRAAPARYRLYSLAKDLPRLTRSRRRRRMGHRAAISPTPSLRFGYALNEVRTALGRFARCISPPAGAMHLFVNPAQYPNQIPGRQQFAPRIPSPSPTYVAGPRPNLQPLLYFRSNPSP
jgi:hypothetical protein